MQQLHPIHSRQKERAVVVIKIHLRSESDLAEIVQVLRDFCFLLRAPKSREEKGDEHGDDGDDDEDFDQGEAGGIIPDHCSRGHGIGFARRAKAKIARRGEFVLTTQLSILVTEVMPDPVDPSQPSPPPLASAPPNPSGEPSSVDLPPNIAAAIACIPLIGGIIFYILEKRNSFVRFYAMQSIIFGGAWLLASVVLKIMMAVLLVIPVIGWFFIIILGILWLLGWVAFLIIFLITVIKAFSGVRWEIPYVGALAQKQMAGGTV